MKSGEAQYMTNEYEILEKLDSSWSEYEKDSICEESEGRRDIFRVFFENEDKRFYIQVSVNESQIRYFCFCYTKDNDQHKRIVFNFNGTYPSLNKDRIPFILHKFRDYSISEEYKGILDIFDNDLNMYKKRIYIKMYLNFLIYLNKNDKTKFKEYLESLKILGVGSGYKTANEISTPMGGQPGHRRSR